MTKKKKVSNPYIDKIVRKNIGKGDKK